MEMFAALWTRFDAMMMSLTPEQHIRVFAVGLGLITLSVALLLVQKILAGKKDSPRAAPAAPCDVPGVALPKKVQSAPRKRFARRTDLDDPFVRRLAALKGAVA